MTKGVEVKTLRREPREASFSFDGDERIVEGRTVNVRLRVGF